MVILISQDTSGANSGKIKIGSGDDLQLYHDGNQSIVNNLTGDLFISNLSADTDIVYYADNGSGSVAEYFRLDGGLASSGTRYTTWPDNSRVTFGADQDLQLYHDGSNSYIDDSGTGNLNIRAANLNLQKYTGETFIACVADGSVSIYHDNAPLLQTTPSGIFVTGVVQSAVYPFSTLSGIASPAAGMRAFVNDSNQSLASHHGAIVAGGGAHFVPVYHDGTNWRIG